MRKMVLIAVAAIALAGCSGGNDAAKQAEIEKLQAEAEKAKAEAAALKRQNDLYEGETAQLQAKAARDRAATEAMQAENARRQAQPATGIMECEGDKCEITPLGKK